MVARRFLISAAIFDRLFLPEAPSAPLPSPEHY
jgi:hypothetical protein